VLRANPRHNGSDICGFAALSIRTSFTRRDGPVAAFVEKQLTYYTHYYGLSIFTKGQLG